MAETIANQNQLANQNQQRVNWSSFNPQGEVAALQSLLTSRGNDMTSREREAINASIQVLSTPNIQQYCQQQNSTEQSRSTTAGGFEQGSQPGSSLNSRQTS